MPRSPETTSPRPLYTSLALLGVGALAIGGMVVALPYLAPQPGHDTHALVVEGSNPAVVLTHPVAVAAPNGTTQTGQESQTAPAANPDLGAATTTAPTAIGGGPRPMDEDPGDRTDVTSAPTVVRTPNGSGNGVAGVIVPTGGTPNVAIGGADGGVSSTTGDAGVATAGGEAGAGAGATSNTAGAGSTSNTAGAGSTSAGDAGAAGTSVSALGAGGTSGTNGGGNASPDNSQLAYPMPMYGAPPASTSTSGPVTNGAAGSTTPTWGGITGGGSSTTGTGSTTTDGNGGIVNPKPSVAATFLVSMSSADDPERAWTSISPSLKSGDMVLARIPGDASTGSVALLGWSDRVKTDSPLVSYIVGVSDLGKLKAMVSKGLPATLDAIGPAQTDGLDLATATTLSTAVHAAGKRFFLSVSSSSTGLSQLGARADIVELVISSSDATAAANEASIAVTALRGTSNPFVFVRLPSAAGASSTAAWQFANAMQQRLPNVGLSIPPGGSTTMLSDLRSGQ